MSEYRQEQCERMLEALVRAGHRGMKRSDFAALLGIKKSQHLFDLIHELVARNLALAVEAFDGHNRKCWFYYAKNQQ